MFIHCVVQVWCAKDQKLVQKSLCMHPAVEDW